MYHNIPKPADTSRIELDPEMETMLEAVARNIHSVWAYKRINEGWVYGSSYSAENKTTPWLVNYDELPETEKNTDRQTVEQTVKMLLLLGYKIEKEDKT